jgi:hypothetical protein
MARDDPVNLVRRRRRHANRPPNRTSRAAWYDEVEWNRGQKMSPERALL